MVEQHAFEAGQLVRCKEFNDFPALVGSIGRVLDSNEWMGVCVHYFNDDSAWHEHPGREIELVTGDVVEEVYQQQLQKISALKEELEALQEALRTIMHSHAVIDIDTPVGEMLTRLQQINQGMRSTAFIALGMDKVYAALEAVETE